MCRLSQTENYSPEKRPQLPCGSHRLEHLEASQCRSLRRPPTIYRRPCSHHQGGGPALVQSRRPRLSIYCLCNLDRVYKGWASSLMLAPHSWGRRWVYAPLSATLYFSFPPINEMIRNLAYSRKKSIHTILCPSIRALETYQWGFWTPWERLTPLLFHQSLQLLFTYYLYVFYFKALFTTPL